MPKNRQQTTSNDSHGNQDKSQKARHEASRMVNGKALKPTIMKKNWHTGTIRQCPPGLGEESRV
eukprot:6222151-Amphidinium_carterae.1